MRFNYFPKSYITDLPVFLPPVNHYAASLTCWSPARSSTFLTVVAYHRRSRSVAFTRFSCMMRRLPDAFNISLRTGASDGSVPPARADAPLIARHHPGAPEALVPSDHPAHQGVAEEASLGAAAAPQAGAVASAGLASRRTAPVGRTISNNRPVSGSRRCQRAWWLMYSRRDADNLSGRSPGRVSAAGGDPGTG